MTQRRGGSGSSDGGCKRHCLGPAAPPTGSWVASNAAPGEGHVQQARGPILGSSAGHGFQGSGWVLGGELGVSSSRSLQPRQGQAPSHAAATTLPLPPHPSCLIQDLHFALSAVTACRSAAVRHSTMQ